MVVLEKIKKLTSQLFPTGRAFKMPFSGELQKLRDALSASEARAYEDAKSVIDSAIPDNDNFSESDATSWERRLGLITNTAVPLADRKLAINRKMNHPGTIKPRQHYLFLQRELQAAGFNVYVHENLSRANPIDITGVPQHGDFQLGDFQHGGSAVDLVANKINKVDDEGMDIGVGYSNCFFIGGEVPLSYADVDSLREPEFRQLILRVKPQNQIAFLQINYI